MTWTTGKISCFAVAMLELPQDLAGRREAAGRKAGRPPWLWSGGLRGWVFFPCWRGILAKFPGLSELIAASAKGMMMAVMRVNESGQVLALVWELHTVGVQQMRPLLFLTGYGNFGASVGGSSGEGNCVLCKSVCPHPVASCVTSWDRPFLHRGAKSATLPSLFPWPSTIWRLCKGHLWGPGHLVPLCSLEWPLRTGWLGGLEGAASFLGTLSSQLLTWAGSPNLTSWHPKHSLSLSRSIWNETPGNTDSVHSFFHSLGLLFSNTCWVPPSRLWGHKDHHIDSVLTCRTLITHPPWYTPEKHKGRKEKGPRWWSTWNVASWSCKVILSLFRGTLWPQTPNGALFFQ